jgi:hypothetical protein
MHVWEGRWLFNVSYLVHVCIRIIVHCQLVILFSIVCWLFLDLSIYLHNNEQQTSGTNIFSYHKWSDGCEYFNSLMRCRWSAIALRSMKRRSCLMHMCIRIVVHCQLVVSFFIVCLLFSSLVELLCYNDAMISRLQQRVPAKHLRLVQLLRIRLRQVMLQYRVAWFSEAALILVVFGRWYRLASLISSDSFPFLCYFSLSLSIYLSTQQRTINIRHQHLLLPQVIRRLWVF